MEAKEFIDDFMMRKVEGKKYNKMDYALHIKHIQECSHTSELMDEYHKYKMDDWFKKWRELEDANLDEKLKTWMPKSWSDAKVIEAGGVPYKEKDKK